MAWVVGLISPIWLAAAPSVNQRLPSGPAAIPDGAMSAVGVGNSLIAIDSKQSRLQALDLEPRDRPSGST